VMRLHTTKSYYRGARKLLLLQILFTISLIWRQTNFKILLALSFRLKLHLVGSLYDAKSSALFTSARIRFIENKHFCINTHIRWIFPLWSLKCVLMRWKCKTTDIYYFNYLLWGQLQNKANLFLLHHDFQFCNGRLLLSINTNDFN